MPLKGKKLDNTALLVEYLFFLVKTEHWDDSSAQPFIDLE